MFKKGLIMMMAGALALGISGAASAATFEVNIYGASAQFGYWNKAAAGFLTTTYGCTSAQKEQLNNNNGITRGLGCTVDGTGSNDDTVYIRYSSVASDAGCTSAPNCVPRPLVDEATCTWGGPNAFNCTATKNVPVTIGAADVECASITQTTTGWANGRIGQATGGTANPFTNFGNPAGYPFAVPMVVDRPIVVPFGFAANNNVRHSVCTQPVRDLYGAPDKTYDKNLWQCRIGQGGSGNQSSDCIGLYKCVNGSCSGGTNAGNSCNKSQDCPDVSIQNTKCEYVPLENLSRLQAILLFANRISNWNQFGPYYFAQPAVKCGRHGGSGTWATLDRAVFRGDDTLQKASIPGTFWHYRSSDLMVTDCVDFYDGAVGVVDADKLVTINTTNNKSHQMKFEGVEPVRGKIKDCSYSFWADQTSFYDSACVTGTTRLIVENLFDFAGNAANLNEALFGDLAKFYATKSEMRCKKANDNAYPKP